MVASSGGFNDGSSRWTSSSSTSSASCPSTGSAASCSSTCLTERYERRSVIVTTNTLAFGAEWVKVFGGDEKPHHRAPSIASHTTPHGHHHHGARELPGCEEKVGIIEDKADDNDTTPGTLPKGGRKA